MSSSSSPKTKTKRILIVDDEPDVTFTLKKDLENSGIFEVFLWKHYQTSNLITMTLCS
jgi:CheY-like chemotaxis protein